MGIFSNLFVRKSAARANDASSANFQYIIKDPRGLHARPACLLNLIVKKYRSKCIIFCGDRSAGADQLMDIMDLDAKQGDLITITAEGPDADALIRSMKDFFESTL